MKILIADTLYDDFIRSIPFDPNSTYETELQKVLDRKFGTFDAYSRNLKALGWDAVDVIANDKLLQGAWANEYAPIHRLGTEEILSAQICYHRPDVVFFQDLSLVHRSGNYLVAAQHSCPWAGDDKIRQCDVIFTSFPHYVPRIEALGVRAIYNPLAFEPSVLDRWPRFLVIDGKVVLPERIHDCVFIGGVGNPSHWKYGMEVLETVAREIPTFKWWGYGVETLPADSLLRQKYQGQAWGLGMYEILLQSKICLNRHGEVAQGYANNMRMYEATGCGAMLLTEEAPNIWDLFAAKEIQTYLTPQDAVDKIRYWLDHDEQRAAIAVNGQKRTLKDHTYAQRMETVSSVLTEMLCPA